MDLDNLDIHLKDIIKGSSRGPSPAHSNVIKDWNWKTLQPPPTPRQQQRPSGTPPQAEQGH
eukprot:12907313-Prorocentrum_lima.AAC.1